MKILLGLLLLLLCAASAQGEESSWIFRPSYYTHDAKGQRVYQYAQPEPAYAPDTSTYHQWGWQYSHYHDGTHIYEAWGDWPYWWSYPYYWSYRPW
jgi:hypothetical protein